jgi:hypothetical protein
LVEGATLRLEATGRRAKRFKFSAQFFMAGDGARTP